MNSDKLCPMDLSGKTVLITGASSGIGRETCILASRLGARVALVARRQEALETTMRLMHGTGHEAYPFDLTKVHEVPHLLRNIVAKVGPLDGLVHSAGVTGNMAIRYLDHERLETMIDLNLKSSFALSHAFRMKQVRSLEGAVSMVFLSSVSSFKGFPGMAAYAATKAGVDALVRTLAGELAKERIRVNSVVPGLIRTEMVESLKANLSDQQVEDSLASHPLGPGAVSDVANGIVFLLSDAARWITGVHLRIDGGLLA